MADSVAGMLLCNDQLSNMSCAHACTLGLGGTACICTHAFCMPLQFTGINKPVSLASSSDTLINAYQ